MPTFKLQFDESLIPKLASRYSYPDEDRLVDEIGPRAKSRGYFTEDEFKELCYWKTPRSQSKVNSNPPGMIEEATRIALSTEYEELRIGVLTLLHGVSWPTASVVLHFAHRDTYPIIDYRALWSLGIKNRPLYYTFNYWWEYVKVCREIADKCRVSMRELDRALWQYSKENQVD